MSCDSEKKEEQGVKIHRLANKMIGSGKTDISNAQYSI